MYGIVSLKLILGLARFKCCASSFVSRTSMSQHSALRNFTKTGKKIVGAGINYRSLVAARNLPTPSKPIIFLKATTSYIEPGQDIQIFRGHDVNYEVELGAVIGEKCRNISESDALKVVGGYCLALDMTDTTLLNEARSSGEPWTLAKSFDTACPVGTLISKTDVPNPGKLRLWLKQNGNLRQNDSTEGMIFSTEQLISFVSKYMTLEPGDVILTGSPAGVAPVSDGDKLDCGLEGIYEMRFNVKAI